jgi:hypothetical protein
MSSGIRYWVTDLPWLWADDTYTYYGADLREVALRRTRIERPPGREWHYNVPSSVAAVRFLLPVSFQVA